MHYSVIINISILAGLFFGAASLSIVLTLGARRLALRLQILDKPDKRKIHAEPVPYLGGIGIFAAFMVYGAVARWLFPEVFPPWFPVAMLSSLILVACGVYDDIKGLSAWVKFPIQILAVLILYYFTDVRVSAIGHPFGGWIEFGPFSVFVTVLWAVLLINAINLIDGMDGLAAGVVGISSFFLFMMKVLAGVPEDGIMALGLAGVCLGFLRYNFSPARIFMGDAGSMFLGFMLAVLSMTETLKGTAVVTMLFPFLVLGIPILDTVSAFLRRLSQGKNPFQGDARHIHHRFLAIGLSDRQTVLVIYFFCVALGLFALVMGRLTPAYRLMTLFLLVLIVGFVLVAMRYLEHQLIAALDAVKAYKEWMNYHSQEGKSGPPAREAEAALDRMASAEASGDKKQYKPPVLKFTLMDKLTRAEEQRAERVLVLADERWQNSLQEILKEMGHSMMAGESVEAEREDLAQGKLGVIIVEEARYGKDISDIIIKAKLLNPEVTILVISGSSESSAVLGLLRLGAYDILPACASQDALAVMIFNALESRYLSRRLRFLQLLFWILVFSTPLWVILGRFVALGAFY